MDSPKQSLYSREFHWIWKGFAWLGFNQQGIGKTQKYDQGAQGRTTTDYKDQWTRTETETTTTAYQTSPVGGSLIEGMPHANQTHAERSLALAKASVAKFNAGIDASGHGVSDQVSGDRKSIGDKVNERADKAIQIRKPKNV